MVGRLRFHVRSHACIAVLAAILATTGLASTASGSQGAHGARHAGYQRGRIHHVLGKEGPASGHPGIGHGPGRQSSYLALGDSLAFGYSQAKFESLLPSEPPSAYNTGYVDDFAHLLKLGNPKLEVINDGCPGETTESFIKGPCEYQLAYPLHHPYVGGPTSSQLSDALAYLQANPNTNPITLDIGANDALGVIEHTCEKKVECVVKEARPCSPTSARTWA